jgi:hypothetical protein
VQEGLRNGDPVTVKIRINDIDRCVPAIFIKVCNHPAYRGRYLVSVDGVDIVVKPEQVEPDPDRREPWQR